MVSEILEQAGFPTDYIVLDFESYYDDQFTLKELTPWEYIQDERFAHLGCACYSVINGVRRNEFFWPDFGGGYESYFKALQSYFGEHLERCTVVVKNARFDILILKLKFGIRPKFVIDVENLAAHQCYSELSLKSLAERFNLPPKGRTADFKGLHWADMDRVTKQALIEYAKHDADLEAQIFEILLHRLSWPEVELKLALHTINLYIDPPWKFNYKLADDLLVSMQQRLDNITEGLPFTNEQLSGNDSIIECYRQVLPEGDLLPAKQGKPHKKTGKIKMIPDLAKDGDVVKKLLAHPDPVVRRLTEARLAIKSWPTHMKRIRSMIAWANACGGKLPTISNYYGAHTGRWQGGGGINQFNLGGAGRAGAGTDPLIRSMRGLMMAPAGKAVVMVDSAQIEARVLAWLADCDILVKGFANNEDIYSRFATGLFQCKVRKPKKSDPRPVYDALEIKRGFGKDAILGAGYGMGASKFFDRCLMNPALRPLFDSGEYDLLFVDRLIKLYRTQYKEIPAWWRKLEQAWSYVTRVEGASVECGRLKLWKDLSDRGGTVNVRLPSGRVLFYPHAVVAADKTLRYGHSPVVKTWGGALTENVVQAISRDLLAEWLLNCEDKGVKIVHHVYDELISLTPVSQADGVLHWMSEAMKVTPVWAEGLPLNSEGKWALMYEK